MENKKEVAGKNKLITISGMIKTFQISTITLYNKYLPYLEPQFVKGRKKYYNYDEVMELHEKLNVDIEGYEIIS